MKNCGVNATLTRSVDGRSDNAFVPGDVIDVTVKQVGGNSPSSEWDIQSYT